MKNLFPASAFGLASLLLTSCVTAHAQQAATGSKWVVASGRTLVQINSDGIHINQRDPKELTHFAILSRRVALPAGQPWKISFEVRFGELRTAGAAIGIFDGAHTLGWIGSDGWYKRTGCFIGKDNETAYPPTGTDWHKFEFSSDGTKIIILDNGVQVGSAEQGGTPSLIKIGDIFGPIPPALPLPTAPPPGWQTEISVRNVQILSLQEIIAAKPKSKAVPAATSTASPDAQQPFTEGQIKTELAAWFGSFEDASRSNVELMTSYNEKRLAWQNGNASDYDMIVASDRCITSSHSLTKGYQAFSVPVHLPKEDQETLRAALSDAVKSAQYSEEDFQHNAIYFTGMRTNDLLSPSTDPKQLVDFKNSMQSELDQSRISVASALKYLDESTAEMDKVISKWGITNGDVWHAANADVKPNEDVKHPLSPTDEAVANTIEALQSGKIAVQVSNITNAFDAHTILDFAVTNNSKKPVMFWTTPTLVFADGSEGAIQSGMVNNAPFRSFSFLVISALTPSLGTARPPAIQGKPVTQAEDTKIAPGQTLYFHCGTNEGNAASTLTQIKFKGGGWDKQVLNVHITGVNTFP